jgi:hypothetical protein
MKKLIQSRARKLLCLFPSLSFMSSFMYQAASEAQSPTGPLGARQPPSSDGLFSFLCRRGMWCSVHGSTVSAVYNVEMHVLPVNRRIIKRVRLKSFYDPIAILAAIPVTVVVLAGLILSYRSHAILRQNRDLVVHTYQVMRTTRDLLLAAEDAETGQRGFLITGNEVFLAPYEQALRTTIPESLTNMDRLLPDDPQDIVPGSVAHPPPNAAALAQCDPSRSWPQSHCLSPSGESHPYSSGLALFPASDGFPPTEME